MPKNIEGKTGVNLEQGQPKASEETLIQKLNKIRDDRSF